MDDESFIRLCEARANALYRAAYAVLGSRQDAEDAVQQALMKGWAARRSARSGGAAWLTRIVVNECRNIQRERRRVTPVARMPEPEPPPEDAPDGALGEAVAALPESLRLPLLLKYAEGFSEKEVAAALGLSLTATKSRLLRARRALRRALGEEVEWP